VPVLRQSGKAVTRLTHFMK